MKPAIKLRTTRRPYVLGVTGGIATGKSTVSAMLRKLGAAVVSSDAIHHELIQPQREGWRAIVRLFGRRVLSSNGAIDRDQLGKWVFGHPGRRRRLEKATHPLIRREMDRTVNRLGRSGRRIVAVEIPLLVEVAAFHHVNEVWLVTASSAVQIKRLKRKNPQWSRKRLQNVLDSQWPLSRKRPYANVIIANGSSRLSTWHQVKKEWKRMLDRL